MPLDSTVANFAIVQKEGEREITRNIEFYSLYVIISVGYCVKSKRGTEFRRWANTVLKQYILNGYAATMFLYFLDKNNWLFENGVKRIAGNTLVALTIMIAERKSAEKELMVNLVMNFLK